MLQKVPSKQLWTFVSSAPSIRRADSRSASRGPPSKPPVAAPTAGRAGLEHWESDLG